MTRPATDIPHRKNAAEWAMWLMLQPVRWFLVCQSVARAVAVRKGDPGGR